MFTSIKTGSFRLARCNFCTFEVIVAEKRYVFLCFGIWVRIRLIYFSKSIDKSLSASSKIRNLSLFKLKPLVFAKWSASRPGVPTMTWGFLERAIAWETMSSPPTRTAVLRPIREPRASNYCAIWTQSSLVGDITQAKNGCAFSNRDWMTGIANAAVFPEPVSARPIMSLPFKVKGSDSAWILLGCL